MGYVYILEGHFEYEGFGILGVFKTREMAEAFQKKEGSESFSDWFEITEHQVITELS